MKGYPIFRILVIGIIAIGFIACQNQKKEDKMEGIGKMQSVKPKEITDNYIKLIGEQWMLVTAGDSSNFNMMTASWGCAGFLWNKPVVFIFIRPQRHTFGFLENNDGFTLSFFEEKYRPALTVCGSVSGRDTDKVEASGLTPCKTEGGKVTFKEARLVLECKKLYADFMNPEAFIDPKILEDVYPGKDYHKIYVAEIVNAWEKK